MKVGGIPIYSGSMFRGNAAYKRKPQIGVSAKFSGFSYGQFTDMIQGVENTKTYTVSSPSAAHFEHGPVKVRFFSGSSPIDATLTESINLSPTSIVDTPYFDIESTGSLGGLIVTL
jgi:predicted DNA-binding helix-hairpin-helix protein